VIVGATDLQCCEFMFASHAADESPDAFSISGEMKFSWFVVLKTM
jgi:hypothetical protein